MIENVMRMFLHALVTTFRQNSCNIDSRRFHALICIGFIAFANLSTASVLAQTKAVTQSAAQAPSGDGIPVAPDAQSTQNTVPGKYSDTAVELDQLRKAAVLNQQSINTGVQDILVGKYAPNVFDSGVTSLAMQAAEQGEGSTVQKAANNILNFSLGSVNDTYKGLHQWWKDDLVGNLFQNIGQLFGKWMTEFQNWLKDCIRLLSKALLTFVLNPNIAVNGLNGSPDDGISRLVRQGADVMYGIAIDLLLLLFICCIWKFWADAAWGGAGNLMGPVGRLIFTAGLMLAWPTIYAFEIQISNEMIIAIFGDPTTMLNIGNTLVAAMGGGVVAAGAGATMVVAPVIAKLALGFPGIFVGDLFYFASSLIFTILGSILLAELVYIVVLKAVQTALLTAQYMFAPVFLVFFATPDTESYATTYVKAFVETSLWTFVWVGLLKVLSIVVVSDYNPWGKILLAIGVLQLMIQVPSFLGRAQISPASDFVSGGSIFKTLSTGIAGMKNAAETVAGRFALDRSNALDPSTLSSVPLGGAANAAAAAAANGGQSLKTSLNQPGATTGIGQNSCPPVNPASSAAQAGTNGAQAAAGKAAANAQQGPPLRNAQLAGAAGAPGAGAAAGGAAGAAGGPSPFLNQPGHTSMTPGARIKSNIDKFLDKMNGDSGFGMRFNQASTSVLGTLDNGIEGVNIAKNASPLKAVQSIFAAAFSDNITEKDGRAKEAAMNSAFASGAHKPAGALDKMAANWLDCTNKAWVTTPRGQQQLNKAAFAEAVLGSNAYVSGQVGNGYTQYLRERYGDWGAAQNASALHSYLNPDAVDSPWNRSVGPATKQLVAAGMPINAATSGAMQHPVVQAMPPTRKKAGANAALWATYGTAKAMYGGMDDDAFQRAHGELARALPAADLQTALAIYQSGGQEDFLMPSSSKVMSLSSGLASQTKADLVTSYSSLRQAAPRVAHRMGVLIGGNPNASYSSIADLSASIMPLQGHTAQETIEMILEEASANLGSMHGHGINLSAVSKPDTAAPVFDFIEPRVANGGGHHSSSARMAMKIVARNHGMQGVSHNLEIMEAMHSFVANGGGLDELDQTHCNLANYAYSVFGNVEPNTVKAAGNVPKVVEVLAQNGLQINMSNISIAQQNIIRNRGLMDLVDLVSRAQRVVT